MTDNLVDRIKNLKYTLEFSQAVAANKVRDILKETFAVLFETCPEVYSVFWSQYTPFFNDGDICDFQVYSLFWKLVSEKDIEDEDCEGSQLYTSDELETERKWLNDVILYNSDKAAYWRTMFSEEEVSAALEFQRTNPAVAEHYITAHRYDTKNPPIPPKIAQVFSENHRTHSLEDDQKRFNLIERKTEKYLERTPAILESISQMEEIIKSIPLDIMEDIYGTGVEVNITRAGTVVEECLHD